MKIIRITDSKARVVEKLVHHLVACNRIFSHFDCKDKHSIKLTYPTKTVVLDHLDMASNAGDILSQMVNLDHDLQLLIIIDSSASSYLLLPQQCALEIHLIYDDSTNSSEEPSTSLPSKKVFYFDDPDKALGIIKKILTAAA